MLAMLCAARDARYNGSTRPRGSDAAKAADEAVDGLYCMTRSAASRLRGLYVPMDVRVSRVTRYTRYFAKLLIFP